MNGVNGYHHQMEHQVHGHINCHKPPNENRKCRHGRAVRLGIKGVRGKGSSGIGCVFCFVKRFIELIVICDSEVYRLSPIGSETSILSTNLNTRGDDNRQGSNYVPICGYITKESWSSTAKLTTLLHPKQLVYRSRHLWKTEKQNVFLETGQHLCCTNF
ncbi:unnamed protein product [Acanthoscelides obtectus]|uniref:Uncharacterized protein n=1 Tax=Acanthoscelides obtectus TaxID=200917 RepID=A0A9P0L0H1_ACAOB|nr:unnamed protein product [Acanthoscelides obtectus]CAK1623392.1 hypothetical protein AOBTE_LOCUS1978 [Acanthoscelides obtectus]